MNIQSENSQCFSSLPCLVRNSSYTAGAPDSIIEKLAELQGSVAQTSMVSVKPTESIDQYELIVSKLLNSLPLDRILSLIDSCHFYLNDIYFPYDIGMMKLKLKKMYTDDHSFILNDNTYFKPLVLATLALGRFYERIFDDSNRALLMYSLMIIGPLNGIYSKKESYLVVSVYTLASYYFRSIGQEADALLYSSLALQIAVGIGLYRHEKSKTRVEELKSRIMWVSFGAARTLSTKMGSELWMTSAQITRSLPQHIQLVPADSVELQGIDSDEFRSYTDLVCIGELIYKVLYPKVPFDDLIGGLRTVIRQLALWNISLPSGCKFDQGYPKRTPKKRRFVCSLHLNYCFCVYLLLVPLLYGFVERILKSSNQVILDGNLLELVKLCLNSAAMTLDLISNCYNHKVLAVYGSMDLDYLCSAAISFFLGTVLEVSTKDTQRNLQRCIQLIKRMGECGNTCAWNKLDRLEDLISSYKKHKKAKVKLLTTSPKALSEELTIPNQSWYIGASILGSLDGLTDTDLNLWKEGFENLSQS